MNKEFQVIQVETKTPAIVDAVDKYNMMVEYVQKVMRPGIDYGVIPGSSKPSLLKPGAEKLQRLFGFSATFTSTEVKEDWDKPLFYYRYKCTVSHGDEVIAECEGSANSYEKKYRYRNVFESQATPEEKEKGVRIEKTSKNGKPYFVYRVENDEPYDLINTLQKMAQKRAYVGAILLAANASEFFTQDIEDLDIVDIDYETVQEKPASPQKPRRPLPPESLAKFIAKKADQYRRSGIKVDEADRKKFIAQMDELALGDDNKCHAVTEYLFGVQSSKDVDDANMLAALDWLNIWKDKDTGEFKVGKFVAEEFNAVVESELGK